MPSWFLSPSDHGQAGYLPHPTQGYLMIERLGDYWHVPAAGRRTVFAERAQAMAEQVAAGRAPRHYVIDTPGRPMTVFAPDLVEPDVWVAAATRGGVANIAGVRRREDAQGNVRWQPLVDAVDVGVYADPEHAMAFALESAHQRLEGNYGLRRRREREGASHRRHIQFQQAITAHAPRGNHKITRAEIQAVQMLGEIGFTPPEIARSMRWSPEVVTDVTKRTLDDAHDRWAGQASYPDQPLPRQRSVRPTSVAQPAVADQARASVWVRHPQGDVLFTARDGRATAQMRDAHRQRTHQLRIEPRTQSGARHWQVMLNGRRLGSPRPKIPDALSFAVNTLHQRAQVRAQVKPVAKAHNAAARRQLEAAARNATGVTAADRQALAAGCQARQKERAAMRERVKQSRQSLPGGLAAILAMPSAVTAAFRNGEHGDRIRGPDMGA